jgi:hypothetical protein
VYGHVAIGPFTDNVTVQHINLDGVEVIAGTLGAGPTRNNDQPYYTLSSSTLRKADAIEFRVRDSKIRNLTLPSLTSMNDRFEVGRYAYDLNYLDITSFESAYTFTLGPPNLTTLHHTRLRNTTDMDLR